jgi:hypothetical protein
LDSTPHYEKKIFTIKARKSPEMAVQYRTVCTQSTVEEIPWYYLTHMFTTFNKKAREKIIPEPFHIIII